MRKLLRLGGLAVCVASIAVAKADTSASATIDLVSVSGGVYTYDIDLMNTGTTDIGTFWYAWVPGEDFLPVSPTSESAPSSWVVNAVTHGGSTDGYAIRWEATTPLAAGDSIDGFMFSITADPSEINGDSPFFPGTPVGTSFVYEGGPFQGGSDQFVVQPAAAAVPGPAGPLTALLSGLGVLIRRRKRSS